MTTSTRRLDTTDLEARVKSMYEQVATEPHVLSLGGALRGKTALGGAGPALPHRHRPDPRPDPVLMLVQDLHRPRPGPGPAGPAKPQTPNPNEGSGSFLCPETPQGGAEGI